MKKVPVLYQIGQVVHHKLFDYRGVILDVDPEFQGSEVWYALMAKSKPAKNKPWYRLLVDKSNHTTYVAEENIEADLMDEPINHPELNTYFGKRHDGFYESKNTIN